MTLIDKNGQRKACDRCHRVRVTIRRGAICEGCREQERRIVMLPYHQTARARKYANRPYADAV